jgi:hypothetical protein
MFIIGSKYSLFLLRWGVERPKLFMCEVNFSTKIIGTVFLMELMLPTSLPVQRQCSLYSFWLGFCIVGEKEKKKKL